jgi:dTDP-4-dehydrorhamnose 3,5-epimerase
LPLIAGVTVKPLKVHADERGYLFEMLRSDEPLFQKFGQAYTTAVYPGVIKAWHYHKKQDDHFICVHGMTKVVLYDSREGSPTHGVVNEFFMGERNPILLVIPKMVYHGMKGIADDTALIVNIPTESYDPADPDEYRLPYDSPEIPYDWALKHG